MQEKQKEKEMEQYVEKLNRNTRGGKVSYKSESKQQHPFEIKGNLLGRYDFDKMIRRLK